MTIENIVREARKITSTSISPKEAYKYLNEAIRELTEIRDFDSELGEDLERLFLTRVVLDYYKNKKTKK